MLDTVDIVTERADNVSFLKIVFLQLINVPMRLRGHYPGSQSAHPGRHEEDEAVVSDSGAVTELTELIKIHTIINLFSFDQF